jgi:hypothetical protein
MTWAGIVLIGLGWGLLLMGGHLTDGPVDSWGRSVTVALRLDLPTIAQALILSGFGLAILAALQHGFGALNRFFEAVLERSAAVPKPKQTQAATIAVPKQPAAIRVSQGRIKDRNYVMFADGSVDVETLLGVRRFPSLGEAQQFIGT